MQEKRRQWLISAAEAARRAAKWFAKKPGRASLAASVAAHIVIFAALALFGFDYHGTIFGNGSEAAPGESLIKVDFIAEERPQSAASSATYNKFAATSRLKAPAGAKKGVKKESAARNAPAPRSLARAAAEPSPAPDAKKELSVMELKGPDPKTAKKIARALEIPLETSKQLEKKLKSPASFDDPGASGETLVKRVIEASDAIENISLSKAEMKSFDDAGELIASTAFAGAVKPAADFENDETLIPEGSSENTADLNRSSSKNGASPKKSRAGSGAYGKPSGSKPSGLVFEMVANSSYDEIPSFLNGPPAIDYPKWAQEQGAEGTVKILLEILPSGEVGMVSKFESPISDRLAQYLIKQAEMWRFKPIYKNGRPLSGTVMVAVDFSLTAGKKQQ